MELQLSTGGTIDHPTPEQIDRAIRSLPGGDDSFAILAANEMTYVQAAGPDADGLFDLEHQLDGLEYHYQAMEPVGTEEVIIAMQAFATGDETWKQAFQWQRQQLPTNGGGCAGMLLLLAVAAVALAILLQGLRILFCSGWSEEDFE
ncbi:MAG: hypothetical protein ACLFVH_08180 [Phycisphaerae bacterium]